MIRKSYWEKRKIKNGSSCPNTQVENLRGWGVGWPKKSSLEKLRIRCQRQVIHRQLIINVSCFCIQLHSTICWSRVMTFNKFYYKKKRQWVNDLNIPITDKPPFFNVQGIHTNIKKYESLSNKWQCCKSVPVIVSGTYIVRWIWILSCGTMVMAWESKKHNKLWKDQNQKINK